MEMVPCNCLCKRALTLLLLSAATQQGKLSQHADSGGRKIIGKAKGMNFVRAEGDANEVLRWG